MNEPVETIERAELVAVIEWASEPCAESGREKLRAVAMTTDAVAVGWFHCDGVGCPARQANYRHQGFQKRFDDAMIARYGRKDGEEIFIVKALREGGDLDG